MAVRVLVLDEDEELCDLLGNELAEYGYRPHCARTPDEACALLANHSFDVMLMDVRVPGRSGFHLCREIVASWPELPVILTSDSSSPRADQPGSTADRSLARVPARSDGDNAMQAMRAGAYDFLAKPFETEELDLVLRRAAERHHLHREVKRLQRVANVRPGFAALLGASPNMEALFDLIERVAQSQASVLIRGESGSGKELIAHAIHDLSRRRAGPFVALNCAAVPDSLLESELFGHERGAFTDAKSSRPGLLRQAHGGTLFLDEIGDMPLGLQAKVLRALEGRTVRPVGGDREIGYDTRIVAATHRDLNAEVARGSFRADLFFRLNVVSIEVPPLRARGDDLLSLANHFLEEFAQRDDKPVHGLSEDAARRLTSYRWPGNVRELRNCMEHAVALARSSLVSGEDLPEYVRSPRAPQGPLAPDSASFGPRADLTASTAAPEGADARHLSEADPTSLQSLFEVERRHVLHVLDSVRGNKTTAAKILGIDRKTLHARLNRYDLLAGGAARFEGRRELEAGDGLR